MGAFLENMSNGALAELVVLVCMGAALVELATARTGGLIVVCVLTDGARVSESKLAAVECTVGAAVLMF